MMTKVKLLAIDDNVDNLDLIEESLDSDEYKVYRAYNGATAYALMMSHPVDVVFLDLMMPDMNGFALLEMLRATPRLMDMPVIVQTAHSDNNNKRRAKELGVFSIIEKPLTPNIIMHEVRKVLEIINQQSIV